MMNIYARTFMIATLTDGEAARVQAALQVRPRRAGWVTRARRWVAAQTA